MALNCKPGQLAWVCVPSLVSTNALGLTALNGRVVRVLEPAPGPYPKPAWHTEPQLVVTVVGPIPPGARSRLQVGDVVPCKGFPDEYLRPFRDFPPEELEQLVEALQA